VPLNGFDVYIRKVVENGQVIFPEAFCLTEEERITALEKGLKLESIERLKKTNRAKFYGQYLNDPLDEEMLEFKRDWFQPFSPSPELSSKLAQIPALISVDPAFRLKQHADFTGMVVTKTLPDNNVYVLEAKGIKVTPKGLVDEIFNLVKQFGNVYKVLVETVTSQIMLMDLLQDEMQKRNVYFLIEEVKPDSNEVKAVRIRNLIPHYANRRIFHAPHLVALEEQLIEFPKGAHDDIIDAMAYQVKYWRAPFELVPQQQAPEGSYAWWHKKIAKRPNVMGKLFNDFRR
jgi:predicted phage terminase large subunit-like protein